MPVGLDWLSGWTFVVGLSLPYPVGRSFVDKCTPMLLRLGAEFIEVQYFFSYPPIDFFAWARIVHGRLIRAFAIGDEGTIWNRGNVSAASPRASSSRTICPL